MSDASIVSNAASEQCLIMPIYEELSQDELLNRYLGGYTQNSNIRQKRRILAYNLRGKRMRKNILTWKGSFMVLSDLPEDRSTVLLLGVTRIPTSPTPARRPCSLPLAAPPTDSRPPVVNARRRSSSSSKKRNAASRNSTLKQTKPDTSTPVLIVSPNYIVNSNSNAGNVIGPSSQKTTPNSDSNGDNPSVVMDRSVDSIGTCSLDVEASVESSDWSEASSVGTLRSASIPVTSPEPRLPSYLSLACTVNGYSITTNYDPERLARSRDTSPHRPNEHIAHHDNLTTTYSIHNNLLSPPNLVPLPIYNNIIAAQKDTNKMSDNTMATTTHHRREFYSSSTNNTTTTYISSESKNITSTIYSSDTVDSYIENGLRNKIGKCVKYETNTLTTNGNSSEKSDYSGAQEKSVIQQRVERLYGPGFLAQGFLLMKRQKNKSYETENLNKDQKSTQEKHSKSMNDQLLQEEPLEGGMKQSTSSPTLPVFRHLRPEFRAQLPIVKAKKAAEGNMQKSVTIPTIVDGAKVNGHASEMDKESCDRKSVFLNGNASINGKAATNGTQDVCDKIKSDSDFKEIVSKDGHYFLSVLEKEATRLLVLADQAEKELEKADLPEEALGYLRSASGKAKLLVSQKMQQFRGLCTNNIKQVEGEAFPTTNEDLQGFWDMIMLQVDQIDALFKELDSLRANNWQEPKPVVTTNGSCSKPKKVIRSTRPLSASAEENRKLREAQRKKMLEEKRKAMREQQNAPTRQSIEIFVPESS